MIKQIAVTITTGMGPGAGTDGEVYLGLGGREFHCDIPRWDNFEEGAEDVYVFGADSNVSESEYNDPRRMRPMSMADVQGFPLYIRFQPRSSRDNWHLDHVVVRVYGTAEQVVEFSALQQGDYLWMGYRSGMVCYLRPATT